MANRVSISYPEWSSERGMAFWLRPKNLWWSRRKIFRSDYSNEWRKKYRSAIGPVSRSVAFGDLIGQQRTGSGFRFLILGDTGEGDRSQYSLMPLIRHLDPAFIVINGDVTYPAGHMEDFDAGFFRPFKGMGIPIWAVPGNHEYYSKHQGAEFFEVFCTRKWERKWADAGLRLVMQPGTYWELRDPEGSMPLVIIGIDTGKKGDLDGNGGHGLDTEQLEWLHGRLRIAQKEERIVIVLFHIPALAEQTIVKKVYLYQLHHLIAKHPCVRLVVGAHYHNYQLYPPEVFRSFLDKVAPAARSSGASPHFVIAGGSGAALTTTIFKKNDYVAEAVYPTTTQWLGYSTIGRRMVDKAGLSRTIAGRVTSLFDESVRSDFDAPGLLSFLSVDVDKNGVSVQPVLMDNVEELFAPGSSVDIEDRTVRLEPNAVQRALRAPAIRL